MIVGIARIFAETPGGEGGAGFVSGGIGEGEGEGEGRGERGGPYGLP